MNNRFLIKFRTSRIRDIMFGSSVAKKIKEEYGLCELHFDVNFLQTIDLLNNNPYVDKVLYKESENEYNKIFEIKDDDVEDTSDISVVKQIQLLCGIKNTDDNFNIYTNPTTDYGIRRSISDLIDTNTWHPDTIKVCYVMDLERRSYSPESNYEKNRNLNKILNVLYDKNIMLFAVGLDDTSSKKFPSLNSTSRFSFTTSMIKVSDYVLGPEGCLTYLSASLGIPTILTTDYLYKQYGTKFNKLYMGPEKYFPDNKNFYLNYDLSDEELGRQILNIISNG